MANEAPAKPSVVMRRFVELVAQKRRELDCSAQDLSNICAEEQRTIISRSTIAKIETGHRSYVTLEEFLALTAVLGIDRSEFISNPPALTVRQPRRWSLDAVFSESMQIPQEQLEGIVAKLSKKYQLTEREGEVLALMIEGISNYDISYRLSIRPVTEPPSTVLRRGSGVDWVTSGGIIAVRDDFASPAPDRGEIR